VNAGKRAAEIIDRLRSLYVKAPPRRESLDGNDTIREMVEMLRYEADRYKVSIHTEFTAELTRIMSDRVQMQQVLMNLVLNAIEAMKETADPKECCRFRSVTRARACRRRRRKKSSNPFSRLSRRAAAWGWRLAGPLSSRTGDAYARARTPNVGRPFISPCQLQRM
jgi:nitrogen-specific signal transduction histidine kinase